LRAAALGGLAVLAGAAGLAAQEAGRDPGSVSATRPALQELLAYYEGGARSQAYSVELRAEAQRQADAVRRRLAEGDFRVGDRVVLSVEGEEALSDTFVVGQGRTLELPVLKQVPLRGVLRSDLSAYLAGLIGRYINNPVVHARSFVRVAIIGEVARPGFYTLPAEMPLPEAIMEVGGPTPTARVAGARIKRGEERIWDGDRLQVAMREARTLDELGLQDGDEVVVPRRSAFAPGEMARSLLVISSVVVALTALFR
jgi:protein involved in polysaccharide export with SLBB domain